MPTHSTLSPVEATTKAVDALLAAIAGNPSAAAVVAFKVAIRRHGVNLCDQAGPEALAAVLARIRTDATDKTQAETRERIVLAAWEGVTGSKEKAA